MNNYRLMYYILFNAITNALEAQKEGNYVMVNNILITAQQNTEDIYLLGENESVASDN